MPEIDQAYRRAGIPVPRLFQRSAWTSILAGHNTLIAAGTGSGKTEAALLPALETGKRILVLYPTKALLQDQHERVKTLAAGKRITIDTGDADDHRFYHSDVVLTNLDKFLYRFFGYGKKRWSYLYPYRIAFAHDREAILVLDEAHAYEEVAFSHLWFLLKKLTYERRVQTVLLSATLPPSLIEALEDSSREHFPRGKDEGNFFEKVEDHENRSGALVYGGLVPASDVVNRSLDFFDQGKRVIVVTRRVVPSGLAQSPDGITLHGLWKQLSDGVRARDAERAPLTTPASLNGDAVTGNVLTYHGHQMPAYRSRVLDRLKALDNPWKADGQRELRQPFVLLTTSATEVGVDISCDVMITDLCEPDSFIQRAGRCARRMGETGEIYLINPSGDRISDATKPLWQLMQQRPSGSPLDAQVKEDLNKLNYVPDLRATPLRLEYLQDLSLYRYVYDFVQENMELWEKGVVITRDWEPSIVVVRSEKNERGDYIGGIPARDFWRGKEIKEKLLLPVSGAADIAPCCAWVLEIYNEGIQYTQRIAIGASTERTLMEALRLAGLNPRAQQQKQNNRVQAVYGLDLPLILLVPDAAEIRQRILPNEDMGLVYHKRTNNEWAKTEGGRWPGYTRSPNESVLRTFGTILYKDSRETELPVYWFEPAEENQR
jgi:CRISPR-associated endonuclease/helicase Cas3